MGDDAAAAARRIVEEVLRRHGAAADAGASGPVAEPRAEAAGDPTPAASTDGSTPATTGAGVGEAATEAARIAHRIVAEVLAGAAQAAAPSSGEPGPPRREAPLGGVSADGLVADDERTVQIEVAADAMASSTGPEAAGGHGPSNGGASGTAAPSRAPDPTGPPGAAPGSAADIVRRIVAEVQEEDRPGSSASPAQIERTRHVEEVPAVPGGESVPVAAGPQAAEQGVAARPLVGWATPAEPVPDGAPVDESGGAKTVRWLLASLLGAIALAVLFPLAVGALRALVSLE